MKIRKLFILICLALFVSSSDQQGQKDVKLYQKTQNLENKAESLPKQIDAIKTEATINSIITSATPRIDYELLGVVCKAGNCGRVQPALRANLKQLLIVKIHHH